MKNSNGILVAVDGTDTDDYMMERAVERAQLDSATLVVAHVVPTALYESRRREIAAMPPLRKDGIGYTLDQAEAGAQTIAVRAARAAVGDFDVQYVAVGAVGSPGRTLLAIAAEYGCGTIVLAEERSWWRRRLGWGARRLGREFAGQIVQVPRHRPRLVDPDPLVIDA